jgi:hypothetical protein
MLPCDLVMTLVSDRHGMSVSARGIFSSLAFDNSSSDAGGFDDRLRIRCCLKADGLISTGIRRDAEGS